MLTKEYQLNEESALSCVVSTQYSVCDIHFCFVSHTLSVPICKREHSLSVGTVCVVAVTHV
jgi:hypothetical protein